MPEPQDRSASRVTSGSVSLVSLTPNAEKTILYCARVSSNQENESPGLINYLVRNGHWSPFEMAHAVMEFTTSRAIAAQILRHRSFSFQEFSQRYAAATEWVEYPVRVAGATNRQSSLETDDEDLRRWWEMAQNVQAENAFDTYREALERGVATEVARFILPLSTQTKLYISGTIRSWIHYFEMRCDPHTQLEHRLLADEARLLLSPELPLIADALGWPQPCV